MPLCQPSSQCRAVGMPVQIDVAYSRCLVSRMLLDDFGPAPPGALGTLRHIVTLVVASRSVRLTRDGREAALPTPLTAPKPHPHDSTDTLLPAWQGGRQVQQRHR